MTEPLRDQFLEAVRTLLSNMTGPREWGGYYPAFTVERVYASMLNMGDLMHLCVLDDDGSFTPGPMEHSGEVDDRCNFVVLIQVSGDRLTPPSRWGNRVLRDVKRTLTQACNPGGELAGYVKLLIRFEDEAVVHTSDGAHAEFQLPCTAMIPDHYGAYI